jgi:hypothetical protein
MERSKLFQSRHKKLFLDSFPGVPLNLRKKLKSLNKNLPNK